MASINKLSVRGVRSFSPEDAEQVLEFYMPLTVIVGANGCGKTTIIESLKFAVCGSLPPGNKSGQAFVHDPRSIGTSVVKANIKLRLTNRAGNTMVVVRSMEVQQKKTTMTFKQLDGVLRATDTHGNRQSMSHKCTELDRQVPLLLGVSKSILENVVFCHQEESSWPLQEGAVLKKKFDDIFDSTRYTKALEVFGKAKKEYVSQAKDLKAAVMEFKSHRHAAHQFQQEIDKYTGQLEDLEENLSQGRQALQENEQEEQKIQQILIQIDELESEIESKRSAIMVEKSVIAKQRKMLKEDKTEKYSLDELEDMLKSFDKQVKDFSQRKQDLQSRMNVITQEIETIRNQQTELQSKVGRLQASKEMHEKNLKDRYEKMVAIGEKYALGDVVTQISQSQTGLSQDTSFYSTVRGSAGDASTILGSPVGSHSQQRPILDISREDMEEYFRAVRRKEGEIQEQLSQQKAKRRQEDALLSNEISDLSGKVKAMESNKDRLHREEQEAREEIEEIRKSQRAPKLRKLALEEAKAHATKAAKERDEANADPRRKDIPIEISSLTNKMDELKIKIENDKSAEKDLRELHEYQLQIQNSKTQATFELEQLQEDIKNDSNTHQFRIYKLTPPPAVLPALGDDKKGEKLKRIMAELHDEVQAAFEERELELTKNTDTVRRLTGIVGEKSALLQQDKQSHATMKGRIAQLQESVEKVKVVLQEVSSFENKNLARTAGLNEKKPRELLDYLTQQLENLEADSGEGISRDAVRRILKKLLKRAQLSEGQYECPCCKRSMETEQELASFESSLKFLASDDSPLSKLDEKTKHATAKYKEWRDAVKRFASEVLESQRLSNEADELENRIKNLEPTVAACDNELQEASKAVESIKGEVSDLREMQDSSKRWLEASLKIAVLREQVIQKEEDFRLVNSDKEGRNLSQVQKSLEELDAKKDEFIERINKLNKEMSTINDRVSSYSQKAARLETNLRNMQEKYDEELRLEERKKELIKKNTDLKNESEKLAKQIAPLKQRVDAKRNQKERAQKLLEEEEERILNALSDFSSDVKDLRAVVEKIEEYDSSAKTDLEDLETENLQLSEKIKAKKEEYKSMRPDFERLKKTVDDQESEKSNLSENIELIKSTNKVSNLKTEIATLNDKLLRVEGRATAEDDIKRLSNQKNELNTNKARLEGRRGEIVESIRTLKRKLSQPEYRTVDEDFRVASIKHDTTEIAVKDIEKYHAALDKALQRYHSIKIGEINTIIRDLWNMTYKGEDITNIEIVSGQEAGSRSSRSYNYRVVMSKGGSKMDMRGRCSAGQRVLASIVIRLALAETFCVNFGCIALDEPTVNLDFQHKKGLAVALAQIIASRQQQSNFQLVLITHDEDFVLMMKNELSTQTNISMPEKYFQIRRDEGSDGKFYSKIDAVDWEELL